MDRQIQGWANREEYKKKLDELIVKVGISIKNDKRMYKFSGDEIHRLTLFFQQYAKFEKTYFLALNSDFKQLKLFGRELRTFLRSVNARNKHEIKKIRINSVIVRRA